MVRNVKLQRSFQEDGPAHLTSLTNQIDEIINLLMMKQSVDMIGEKYWYVLLGHNRSCVWQYNGITMQPTDYVRQNGE